MRLDTKRKAAYVRVNAARKSPCVYYMCVDALPSPRTVCSLGAFGLADAKEVDDGGGDGGRWRTRAGPL
jgi:hypothetical protein